MFQEVDECPNHDCKYYHYYPVRLYDTYGDPGHEAEEDCDLDWLCIEEEVQDAEF